MSHAFVKEEAGQPWTPPTGERAYRVVWVGDTRPEVLRETDDLLDALHWMAGRPRTGFEVRDRHGVLLATTAA
ncbi:MULTISPECIES: hypothetical protein [Deinococcus]|jgi:hypothetical protein|uniref:Uncharacterized protein n=2 Tax=Deinococcus TaxID=1298 RepID=A0A221STC6_9DEIO|nr:MULTISPECIES: hypothetical protein [Deinococcus]ASN79893.1 hypothetical protein DFI_01725 [Deinococcus ficus]MDP9766274.1 hypothetical protein [Deinococcus enclensis]GHF76428.1 hypothetical protein GCM10017782_12690 [Deinococcus ficus]